MKQQTLFDVPPDRPSLYSRIQAFKAAHGIWTNRAAHMTDEEGKWCAMKAPDYVDNPKAHPIEIIADYCRLLDESGHLVEGSGELAVIRKLCQNLKIPCDL